MHAAKRGEACAVILLWTFCVGVSTADAATYYVSGSSGNDSNAGTLASPWRTLQKANSTLRAGDTVYIRGGTYGAITGSAVDPAYSGTEGSLITYSSYNSEDVQFVGSGLSSFAIDLDSDYGTVRSYIKIHDLHFTGFMKHLWIKRGGHNEISYCSFAGFPPEANASDIQGTWSASYIYRQAQHNWIHHSTFGQWGYCEPYGTAVGVVFQVGLETSTSDYTMYNLVEYCEFYQGGHHVVSFNGTKNVYRYNYCHNEPWFPLSAPTYSSRTFFQTGADGDGQYNLVEGNRIGYGGPKNSSEIGGAGGTMAGAYNIWRRNVFVQVYTDANWVTWYSGQTNVKYNHVYNNTYWHGGYGNAMEGTAYWDYAYTHPVCIAESDGSRVYGNVFKNNIFSQNRSYYGGTYSIISFSTHKVPSYQVLANNWLDSAGDPGFVDTSGAPDPAVKDQWNFALQPGSPCIDSGGFLTTITSANGTGNSFTVADAGYFMDGWGIVEGDIIQLHGQSLAARIVNVDYVTNTITVNSSLTWISGQGVSLQYQGSAPDIGAYESAGSSAPRPPSGLRLSP